MGHLENWVEDSARQRLVREVDVIQSEWPAHTGSAAASGWCAPTSGSGAIVLSVPSSRWFKWRYLVVDNDTAVLNTVGFYTVGTAAAASASIFQMHIAGNSTEFLAMDCITVGNDLYAQADTGNLTIRVGGVLVNSGPEN